MVAAFLAGQAKAADDEPNPFAHRNVLTARVALPFVGGDDGRGFTILGVSLGQRFLNLVEVEAGISEQWLLFEEGTTIAVRAGLSPSVLNPRPSGTHWNLRIPLLAGFSYYKGSGGKVSETPFVSVSNVYHFDTGLDATYWGKSGSRVQHADPGKLGYGSGAENSARCRCPLQHLEFRLRASWWQFHDRRLVRWLVVQRNRRPARSGHRAGGEIDVSRVAHGHKPRPVR